MALRKPYMTRKGYIVECHPGHPRADKNGYVFAHIIAYEKHAGTQVPLGYVVHHINGIKTDNRPENLTMMTSREHTIFHNKSRRHSPETKAKISERAKARLCEPSNHPRYLNLDIDAIRADKASGMLVKDICEKYGISKNTFYARVEGYRRKK